MYRYNSRKPAARENFEFAVPPQDNCFLEEKHFTNAIAMPRCFGLICALIRGLVAAERVDFPDSVSDSNTLLDVTLAIMDEGL